MLFDICQNVLPIECKIFTSEEMETSCKCKLCYLTLAFVESSGSVMSNFDSLRPKTRVHDSFSLQRHDTNK